jgi:hypothetical protein
MYWVLCQHFAETEYRFSWVLTISRLHLFQYSSGHSSHQLLQLFNTIARSVAGGVPAAAAAGGAPAAAGAGGPSSSCSLSSSCSSSL